MAGQGNSLVLFNEGEEVMEGDLNALQNCLTERAWEVPGWADMTAFDEFSNSYMDAFSDNGAAVEARNFGVFTRGGGLLPSASGLVSSMTGGMIGIWNRYNYAAPPDDPTVARSVRWVYLAGSAGWTYTHDATTTGYYRYDIVTCKIDEAAGVPVTRPFQDAITGAQTATSGNKQTALTLDLDASTAVTKGTEAASLGAATIPAIPSGRRILYYVLVHSGALTVYDCTVPAGRLLASLIVPGNEYGMRYANVTNGTTIAATPDGTLVSTGVGDFTCLPPAEWRGDPSVRILGARVWAKLQTGDTTYLRLLNLTAGTNAALRDVSSSFYHDGQQHHVGLDFRGLPASTGYGPLWGTGASTKARNGFGECTCPGIGFGFAATGSVLYSVMWYAIRG